ncbi:MAG: hypothetical protein A3J09_02495 [Candidatus Zambryskibacteria bacterium RIFCSPLOWO2_02_FULL_51_21]|uniref:Uncharacterized protein n=1 Tax=Candidatus Zambryskibacteria bacterium RIFCSPHIGHO2_02_FULL_43_37 TaxID=1802749 RepID=A0A1G2TIA1_9BACT|nr:MAG: hypothetical protein A2723_02485 [Candidatus Zambryskibacteria bacterium RIFCSPHIGHO2_01_FULL_52_18]OHA96341.1 MAG: hypothetical protein A3D49_00405 [Candidatus Zambryskibacteria bacterium RIFCSPHIGHO2_02_FULL_43_37]OHB07744.1 MAG: hypothetical protein A2944_00280 [Candidatus Zambryskibacteria bacterium RIFCSPLOWO2_01_FULL_52_12]OHB11399.1 MAG: hypothetical protein A3J09_02495 [Candidatus Zambryskibacteria bacterium RIFCSPLOWO2_02_FULL_51_21]
MKNLSKLLERFSNILNKDTETKNTIIRIIKDKTNIELKSNQINLKNGVLEVEASPVVKNEIRLKEDLLKQELKISRILYK